MVCSGLDGSGDVKMACDGPVHRGSVHGVYPDLSAEGHALKAVTSGAEPAAVTRLEVSLALPL